MKNFVFKIDHAIAEMFHNIYLAGGEFANFIMQFISFIAEAGILFLLVGIGLALFKRTRQIGATILFAVAIGFLLTNVILKNTIQRARPFQNSLNDFYKWWLDAGANYEGGYSFPSGHTTATTAFAVAIFLTCKKKYSSWILLFPLLMASSRIYLMVHYFSDCVGGLFVGSVSAILGYLIVKWIYTSKLKLFVWARELNLFKPSKTRTTNTNTPNDSNTEKPKPASEDYVYITQAEEVSAKSNQTATPKDEENSNNE